MVVIYCSSCSLNCRQLKTSQNFNKWITFIHGSFDHRLWYIFTVIIIQLNFHFYKENISFYYVIYYQQLNVIHLYIYSIANLLSRSSWAKSLYLPNSTSTQLYRGVTFQIKTLLRDRKNLRIEKIDSWNWIYTCIDICRVSTPNWASPICSIRKSFPFGRPIRPYYRRSFCPPTRFWGDHTFCGDQADKNRCIVLYLFVDMADKCAMYAQKQN